MLYIYIVIYLLLQITALDDLSTNPCYEDIREFYADYNNISSINKLEGSKFLDNYALLSLRYNKIKSVSKDERILVSRIYKSISV